MPFIEPLLYTRYRARHWHIAFNVIEIFHHYYPLPKMTEIYAHRRCSSAPGRLYPVAADPA